MRIAPIANVAIVDTHHFRFNCQRQFCHWKRLTLMARILSGLPVSWLGGCCVEQCASCRRPVCETQKARPKLKAVSYFGRDFSLSFQPNFRAEILSARSGADQTLPSGSASLLPPLSPQRVQAINEATRTLQRFPPPFPARCSALARSKRLPFGGAICIRDLRANEYAA